MVKQFLARMLGLQAKENPTGRAIASYFSGQSIFTPRRYDKLAEEGFQKNIVAYRCVSLIAGNAAAVPWQVFDRRGKKEFEKHPLLDLLQRPNPVQAGAQFFEAAFGFFLLSGNGYISGIGPDNKPPAELWNQRPDRMTVKGGARGFPEAYVYQVGGNKVMWEVDQANGTSEILHVKSFHPLDDWYGLSPLEAAAFSIDQHNEAGKWNARLLQNSGAPSGFLIYAPKNEEAPNTLTDDEVARIDEALRKRYTGGENAGRPLVLEGGLDWKQMSLSPRDMDWLKGRDLSARDIAQAYNVPPQLIGIEGSQTYANFEQATLALYDDAVLPLLDRFKDEMNRWLAPAFGDDIEIGYDKDEIEALAPRRKYTWDKVQTADFLTINEKREAVGYEKIDGGDVILVPAAMLPLGDNEPEQNPLDAIDNPDEGLDDETPEERRRRLHLLGYGNNQGA